MCKSWHDGIVVSIATGLGQLSILMQLVFISV